MRADGAEFATSIAQVATTPSLGIKVVSVPNGLITLIIHLQGHKHLSAPEPMLAPFANVRC